MSSTYNIFRHEKDPKSFAAGEVIFQEGDYGTEMYIIIEGEVEISARGQVKEVVGSGDLIGEMALIDAKPRSATATAKTDVKLAAIDQKRFTFLVQETPFFALHVMQVMANRLRRMHGTIS